MWFLEFSFGVITQPLQWRIAGWILVTANHETDDGMLPVIEGHRKPGMSSNKNLFLCWLFEFSMFISQNLCWGAEGLIECSVQWSFN